MANKVLETTLKNVNKDDMKAGYAAPAQQLPNDFGEFSTTPPNWSVTEGTMTTTGSARAALVLFAIVVATGTWAWLTIPDQYFTIVFFVSLFTALGFGIVTSFRPKSARITAPLYAAAEGVVLGMISRMFEDADNGIVTQAILATGAIVFVMYTLYSTRIIKVTARFRKIVFASLLAAGIFIMADLIFLMFGADSSMMAKNGIWGFIIPGILIVIGAGMLATDFDFIERGSQAGLPKYMDWAAAYGLIVTIVWIYINVLRLLANSRN